MLDWDCKSPLRVFFDAMARSYILGLRLLARYHTYTYVSPPSHSLGSFESLGDLETTNTKAP
jgi:hypothetical protein